MKDDKLDLKAAFKEYARKEMEFYKTADKTKVYTRVLPNLKEKDSGCIDFYYNGIIVGGNIYKDTITLTKLRVTKVGKEEDVEEAISKVIESIAKAEMTCDNQLKQYNISKCWMPEGLKIMSMSPA